MRWILLWIIPLVQDQSLDLMTSSPACYHCAMDAPSMLNQPLMKLNRKFQIYQWNFFVGCGMSGWKGMTHYLICIWLINIHEQYWNGVQRSCTTVTMCPEYCCTDRQAWTMLRFFWCSLACGARGERVGVFCFMNGCSNFLKRKINKRTKELKNKIMKPSKISVSLCRYKEKAEYYKK